MSQKTSYQVYCIRQSKEFTEEALRMLEREVDGFTPQTARSVATALRQAADFASNLVGAMENK